jgi:hypothetical protein
MLTLYPSLNWVSESANWLSMPKSHPKLEAPEVPVCSQVFADGSSITVQYDKNLNQVQYDVTVAMNTYVALGYGSTMV